jgi:hypothetical protein
MEVLIVSGVIVGLHLFWNAAVNQYMLVSNSGGFVRAESCCSTVQRDCEFCARRLHTLSTQNYAHTRHRKFCSRLPIETSLTPLKKSSLNPETFCTVENWHRRTFAIFSLFILCFTKRATQHRKTLTSKDKYWGFYYINNLIPTFQWSTFLCFPQFLIRNTGGMSVYLYSLPSFGVIMCILADGLSQPSGFPTNLIVISGFQEIYTVTSANDKGPVRSLKELNTIHN